VAVVLDIHVIEANGGVGNAHQPGWDRFSIETFISRESIYDNKLLNVDRAIFTLPNEMLRECGNLNVIAEVSKR
jgi:hypothetical protein